MGYHADRADSIPTASQMPKPTSIGLEAHAVHHRKTTHRCEVASGTEAPSIKRSNGDQLDRLGEAWLSVGPSSMNEAARPSGMIT